MCYAALGLVITVALAACKKGEEPKKEPPATPVAKAEPEPEARPKPPPPVDESGITWIKDDYDRAIAESKKSGKPLVIDMWAPWCHTCLSMKQYVLIDKALSEYADRFVWLALDTDRDENAAAVSKFPPAAWPTFFVIGPDEKIASRYVGAATVDQLRSFLTTGERAVREGARLAKGSPEWHMRDGDRKAAADKHAEAARAYAAALAAAPDDWPRRPDILVSQIASLYRAQDFEGCARLGDRIGESLPSRSASTSDFAWHANLCSTALPEDEARQLRSKLLATLVPVLEDPRSNLSIDDRSDGWRIVREIHIENGDERAAIRVAKIQRKILDEAAASAHSAWAAMTYNWPRSEVYTYLGVGGELVDDLEKSARELPKEYDPPYRLAWLLLKLDRHDEAKKHAERAVELLYGPRKARALGLLADIHEAAGDAARAREIREQVLAHVQALPEGQRSESLVAWAKSALDPKADGQ